MVVLGGLIFRPLVEIWAHFEVGFALPAVYKLVVVRFLWSGAPNTPFWTPERSLVFTDLLAVFQAPEASLAASPAFFVLFRPRNIPQMVIKHLLSDQWVRLRVGASKASVLEETLIPAPRDPTIPIPGPPGALHVPRSPQTTSSPIPSPKPLTAQNTLFNMSKTPSSFSSSFSSSIPSVSGFRSLLGSPIPGDLLHLQQLPLQADPRLQSPPGGLLLKEDHKPEELAVLVGVVGDVGSLHAAEALEAAEQLLVGAARREAPHVDPPLVELRLVPLEGLSSQIGPALDGAALVEVGRAEHLREELGLSGLLVRDEVPVSCADLVRSELHLELADLAVAAEVVF